MSMLVVLHVILAVTVLIAVSVVFLIFQVRLAYAEQRGRFVRAITAAERLQILQPELLDCLRRIESDANALQKIALQIEAAVAVRQGPEVRFSVLKQWTAINSLAILHRASRGWANANDLIATIPPYLEAQAEVLDDSVLLIGTREHPERLAIPLKALDPSSEFSNW